MPATWGDDSKPPSAGEELPSCWLDCWPPGDCWLDELLELLELLDELLELELLMVGRLAEALGWPEEDALGGLEDELGMLEDELGELEEGLGMLGEVELGMLEELGILGMEEEDEEELEVVSQPANTMADKPSMIKVDFLRIFFIPAFIVIIPVLLQSA